MRRLFTHGRLAIAAACFIALTASPTLAARPEKTPLGGFTVPWPAGTLCDFAVEWDFAPGGNQLVFPEQPNGDVVSTDGPYAEAKEVLGGFYLIEAEDLDEAIRWAAQIPAAWRGKVEVRPVFEMAAPPA